MTIVLAQCHNSLNPIAAGYACRPAACGLVQHLPPFSSTQTARARWACSGRVATGDCLAYGLHAKHCALMPAPVQQCAGAYAKGADGWGLRMGDLKTWLLALAGLLVVFFSKEIGGFVGKFAAQNAVSGYGEGGWEEITRKVAVDLNKQLPMTVDNDTTLLAVTASGKTMTYHHKINRTYNENEKGDCPGKHHQAHPEAGVLPAKNEGDDGKGSSLLVPVHGRS